MEVEKEKEVTITNVNSVEPIRNKAVAKQGFFASVFGQIFSLEFWKEICMIIVREATLAALGALGGSLVHIARKKASEDSGAIRGIAYGGGLTPTGGAPAAATPSANPSTAFSQSYAPKPSYTPTYPTAQPASTPAYPGFQ